MGQNLWDGNGSPPDEWFVDANWSLGHWPTLNETARDESSSVTIRYLPGFQETTIQEFQGVGTPSGRRLRLEESAVLSTTQRATKSGSDKYTIELLGGVFTTFNAGNETFGFDWVIDGDFAQVSATTFGYGNVDVRPGHGLANIFASTIDCGFQLPIALTPITGSRWKATGESQLNISVGGAIENVGSWFLMPSQEPANFAGFNANTFTLWPDGGHLHMHGAFGGLNVGLEIPRLTLPGSSELRYVPFGQSSFGFALSDQGDARLEFLADGGVAGALLRPRRLPPDPENPGIGPSELEYPAAVPVGNPPGTPPRPSLEFHFTDGVVEIETKVAREGKGFDGSYADLTFRRFFTLQAHTPDVCNIGYIDYLFQNPSDPDSPVTCFPFTNRNAKYWRRLKPEFTTVFTTRDTISNPDDNPGNQDADYRPAGNPFEASYFCTVELPSGQPSSLVGEGQQPPLRLYAREVINPNPEDFPVIPIGLTRYMDSDLDFDVDMIDFARFQNSFTGANTEQNPNAHATWYSLADWGTTATNQESDGDVDLFDYEVFYDRWHRQEVPDQPVPPEPPDLPDWRVCSAADLPLENLDNLNGDPETVVCGGPLHVRPTDVPPLDCPDSLYPDASFGGGGESLSGGGEGLLGGESMASASGEDAPAPAETVWPPITGTPEAMAASLSAALPAGDLASFAASLLADGQASGDAFTMAVAGLLGA